MKTDQTFLKTKVTLVASLAVAAACSAHGATVVVPIGNSSFEIVGTALPGGTAGTWHALPNPGDWVTTAAGGYHIRDSVPGGSAQFPVAEVPDGTRYLNIDPAGTLTQNLGTAISIGDIVEMTFFLGNGAVVSGAPSGINARFTIDGSDVSFDTIANTADDGKFVSKTVQWTATSSGNLGIKFFGPADNWIDDVSVSVTPIPEPSVALLGGLGALVLLRRRRA